MHRVMIRFVDSIVCFESPDEEILEKIRSAYGRGEEGDPPEAVDLRIEIRRPKPEVPRYLLDTDPPGALPYDEIVSPTYLECLASQVNEWWARGNRKQAVFHAGGVSRVGRGILLPGPSGCGKSTLTAHLLRRGFGFFSDELGIVDLATSSLRPYPRALSLHPGSFAPLGLDRPAPDPGGQAVFVPPSALDPRTVTPAPAPLRFIIGPRYEPRGSTRMEPLGPGDAFDLLMGQCCNPSEAIAGWIIETVQEVPSFRLTFDRMDEAGEAVEDLLGSRPSSP